MKRNRKTRNKPDPYLSGKRILTDLDEETREPDKLDKLQRQMEGKQDERARDFLSGKDI